MGFARVLSACQPYLLQELALLNGTYADDEGAKLDGGHDDYVEF